MQIKTIDSYHTKRMRWKKRKILMNKTIENHDLEMYVKRKQIKIDRKVF